MTFFSTLSACRATTALPFLADPRAWPGIPQAHLEEKGVVDELQFLVQVHELRRIVLIAHDGCAFYTSRLEFKDRRLELVQRADLVRVAAYIHRVTQIDAVDAYFARLLEGRIQFEPIEV
jgi:hypothetical protein